MRAMGRVAFTAADAEMVRFVGRMRLATSAQLSLALGSGQQAVYRRAHRLTQAGLLAYHRVYSGRPGVYRATGPGLHLAGSPLRACSLDLLHYRHDLALVSLALELMARYPQSSWCSERELRAGRAPGQSGHTPDGVLQQPGMGMVAIELELSAKPLHALGRILRFYARSRQFSAVQYFLADAVAAERYRRWAGPYPHIAVCLWRPPADALPPAGGTRVCT